MGPWGAERLSEAGRACSVRVLTDGFFVTAEIFIGMRASQGSAPTSILSYLKNLIKKDN